MGPSEPRPITARARREWGGDHGYSEDDMEVFEAGIIAMDEVYLGWHRQELEKALAANRDGGKGRKKR